MSTFKVLTEDEIPATKRGKRKVAPAIAEARQIVDDALRAIDENEDAAGVSFEVSDLVLQHAARSQDSERQVMLMFYRPLKDIHKRNKEFSVSHDSGVVTIAKRD